MDKQQNIEANLLRALAIRTNYDRYVDIIDKNRLMDNTCLLLKDYNKYFNAYEHSEIDWQIFYSHFAQEWHHRDLDEEDIKYYRDYELPAIQSANDEEIPKTLLALEKKSTVTLLKRSLDVDLDIEEVRTLVDNYEHEYNNVYDESKALPGFTASTILEEDHAPILDWFLPSLQASNGGISQGDLIIVCAYSDVGKGAFCASQAAKTLSQRPEGPVLYYTSEDAIKKAFGRIWSCLYRNHVKDGFKEIITRFDEVSSKFIEGFGDNSLIIDTIGFGDMPKIEKGIKACKPSLVIVDMADALCEGEENASGLKRVYDRLRQLANMNCPIIATSQTRDTSYWSEKDGKMMNKKWLDMSDLYNSKVGKPGAATTIVGIAKDPDFEFTRYIHTPKNKGFNKIKATCELQEEFSYYKEL